MERYGVVSEGELMSGHIVTIKNRISDKEVDDMNLYNTNQVGRQICVRRGVSWRLDISGYCKYVTICTRTRIDLYMWLSPSLSPRVGQFEKVASRVFYNME